MNKTSRRLANLGMVSRRVRVGEKGSKWPSWLGKASNRNIQWKMARNTEKRGGDGIKLTSCESLNLRRERRKTGLEL